MLPKHVKVRKEKFGSVIFDVAREKVYITDKIGSEILDALRSGKSLDELINYFSELYDCQPDIIRRDIQEFIEELRKANLIEETRSSR